MKVFKKIIAGVIAGTLVLAMATSAFAATATVTTDGKVTATGFNQTSGDMTVMVVSADAYEAQVARKSEISADDICYIDQAPASEIMSALTSGLKSRNLKYGDYYVVVGGAGEVQKSEVFGSIKVSNSVESTSEQTGKTVRGWEVKVTPALIEAGLTAQFFRTENGETVEESAIHNIEWAVDGEPDDYVITGEGVVSFEVVTEILNADYAETTELEIASGAVSNRN